MIAESTRWHQVTGVPTAIINYLIGNDSPSLHLVLGMSLHVALKIPQNCLITHDKGSKIVGSEFARSSQLQAWRLQGG